MDEELFGEGSSSEEEEHQQQEEQEEEGEESGDDSSGSEKEETVAAAGSDSDAESKASSVGGEEKSEEESGNEQEGSDEEVLAHGTDEQQEQEGTGDDNSAVDEQVTAASSGDEEQESEAGSAGGQTPVQSDSDEDQIGNPETVEAEKSESEEEQSDGEDNRETKESEEEGEDNKEKTTAESSDSGSEIGGKRPKVQDSDSSDDDNAAEKAEKSDLFGDADDISSSDEEKMETQEKQEQQEEEEDNETRRAMVYSEDEEQEEVKQQPMEEEQQETRIEVEIPKINTDLGSSIHFVRFPNFVSVETRPFDPAVYEDEIEDDELLDEEGRTRMKLKVENTIRWKKYVDENGMQLTESNARLVRWSDGSMSMHLGSEIFDVHVMPLQGDHNHLFIRQGTGLQGQAVFKTKLTFRPHSTKSATHRKMTSRLAMRLNQNQQKVRVLPIAGQDPESRKAKLMKEEEDQLRAHMRREAQKRRMREKAHARGLNTNYLDDRLEEEDDSGAISVSAIKNKFKPGFGGVGRGIYSSDSDSGDEKQLTNAKRLESDDSDDDPGKKKRSEEGEKKKKYVVSDSESENEDNRETTAGTSENPTADESMEQASDSDE